MANYGRLVSLLVCVSLSLSNGDHHHAKEPSPAIKVPHGEGDSHNSAYDHEAILGSTKEEDKFSHYTAEESAAALGKLVDKMDLNNDGFIETDELTAWITTSFHKLAEESLESSMSVVDENGDGNLTWVEYLHGQFGYTEEELEKEREKNEKNSDNHDSDYEMIVDERRRFKLADENKDGWLSIKEYDFLEHPQKSDDIRDFEATATLATYDADVNEQITLEEYIDGDGRGDNGTDEMKQEFQEYDKNSDGVLDRAEIRDWVTPMEDGGVKAEVQHLIWETDADKDGRLTKAEIVAHSELWVGSQVTQYGDALQYHDSSEL